jgi:NTE family protein
VSASTEIPSHPPRRDSRADLEIGLALSGGGIRAAVFHLGVFRRLADEGLLESVAQISSVSGGSLAVAALFSHSDLRWPTSSEYCSAVYPKLRTLISKGDLFSLTAIGWSGIARFNRMIFTERARILSAMLASRWNVIGRLTDLPDRPYWWINTCESA